MIDQRLSDTVQNYLVSTLRLRTGPGQPVPLSELAKSLSVSPISVNDMCRKLQKQGLMIYRPYKGALLTKEGQRHAHDIIRRHRLWEVFLVEKLGFDYDGAHEAAHRLEHATGDLVADRLDAFLAYPAVNPQGEPIPRHEGGLPSCITLFLSEIRAGAWAHILQIRLDQAAASELDVQGVRPGARVQVLMVSEQTMLLDVDGNLMSLARALTDAILVEPVDEDGTYPCTMHPLPNEKGASPDASGSAAEPEPSAADAALVSMATLEVGQHAEIVRIGVRGPARQRMLDMGIVSGTDVEVVRVAPLGDPVEFRVKGYSLSLRKSEAEAVMVKIHHNRE